MKFEFQETSMNDSYITALEDCVKSVNSKVIITQNREADVPLVSTQVMHIQDNVYESFELGKPFPPLILLEQVAFDIKSPFIDSPCPLIVDYSLTSPSYKMRLYS